MGFAVPELPSGRESFSPDASYYVGPLPDNPMRFVEGPPTFAVEVRSENDYGNAAEEEMAAKRADYFLAGTLVVWDVDPIAECVRKYLPRLARSADPIQPRRSGRCRTGRTRLAYSRGSDLLLNRRAVASVPVRSRGMLAGEPSSDPGLIH